MDGILFTVPESPFSVRDIVLRLVEKIKVFEKGRIKIVFRFQYDYEMALQTAAIYQEYQNRECKGEDQDGQKK